MCRIWETRARPYLRLFARRYSIPIHTTGRWHPGNSRVAVRYAAMAWSDSSWHANACPNPILIVQEKVSVSYGQSVGGMW